MEGARAIARSHIEGRQDRAGTGLAPAAFVCQPFQRIARLLQGRDLAIEHRYPSACQSAGTAAILTRIKRQQFPDFIEREASALRLPDETQATQIVTVISPDPAVPGRNGQ